MRLTRNDYVTADHMVLIDVALVDPLQPVLDMPGLPDHSHLVTYRVYPLKPVLPPFSARVGGVWWERGLVDRVTARMEVLDGDDVDSVERRARTAWSGRRRGEDPTTWWDMDLLEHEYNNDPEMDDRSGLIYSAVQDVLDDMDLTDSSRRWVGLTNVTYYPAEVV